MPLLATSSRLLLIASLTWLLPTVAPAGEMPSLLQQIAAARRDVEVARQQLRCYDRDLYPAEIRRFDLAIAQAEARMRNHDRVPLNLGTFDPPQYPRPFLVSLERERALFFEAKHCRDELINQRFLYIQEHPQRWRALQSAAQAAEEHLRQLLAQLDRN